jgi:hypothetical protein
LKHEDALDSPEFELLNIGIVTANWGQRRAAAYRLSV